jgi:uncharacterized protein
MDRVNQIMNHAIYQEAMNKNEIWEKDRIYCKHGLEHQLDVARIAYIFSLEEGFGIDKEIIYAIALLHDVGRFMEYEGKLAHDRASAMLAEDILRNCSYDEEESEHIKNCILAHSNQVNGEGNILCNLIYKADKLARNCFDCKNSNTCKWNLNKRNIKIIV